MCCCTLYSGVGQESCAASFIYFGSALPRREDGTLCSCPSGITVEMACQKAGSTGHKGESADHHNLSCRHKRGRNLPSSACLFKGLIQPVFSRLCEYKADDRLAAAKETEKNQKKFLFYKTRLLEFVSDKYKAITDTAFGRVFRM